MIASSAIATSESVFVRCVRLRCRRRGLWLRELWKSEGQTSGAISDAEFDRLTLGREEALVRELSFYDSQARELTRAIDVADEELATERRWRRLCDALVLADHEQRLLLLGIVQRLDPEIGRVYAYLQDRPQAMGASLSLSASLWPGTAAISVPNLQRWSLASASDDLWQADEQIVVWLVDGSLPGLKIVGASEVRVLPKLYPEVLSQMLQAGDVQEIELVGPKGSGRRTLAAQFAAESGRDLLVIDTEMKAHVAERAGKLLDAVVYCPAESAMATPRIIGRETPAEDASVSRRSIELPALSKAARLTLWVHLGGEVVPESVAEWTLSPAEIIDIFRGVPQRRALETGGLLSRLPCPYEPDDLVLAPGIRDHLAELEAQIRLRNVVYDDWGFNRLVPMGRGILALFAGPSGTGKTMAAQVLARSLGRDLYRLDLANVVNKYIGETEKRLKQVFDAADRSHAVLLIDECDALFGQRMTAKDAHDRYANIEIDYLLQRVERFEGIGILATNRKNDLDPAFLRRIRIIIDFLQPGPKERAELWRKTLAPKSPTGEELLGEIDFEMLAQKLPLTGAEIKLAGLGAAFLAKSQNSRIGMQHVMAAARREMSKRGTVLRVNE